MCIDLCDYDLNVRNLTPIENNKLSQLQFLSINVPEIRYGSSWVNHGEIKGIVAVISPWNLPLLLMTWKVGPALACGNTVVVKPSSKPKLSLITLAIGAKQLVVQDAFETMVSDLEIGHTIVGIPEDSLEM
mgnify:CR=1 FL=1